jgi:hypothetical protein
VSVGPGAYQMGGGGEQPFDRTGADVIGAMRHHLGPPRPYARLTEEERTEAEAAAREEAKVCRFCIAIHPLPNGPGCPRLLTFELDGDGRVVKGTYRTDDMAWQVRVILLEDAHEDGEEGGGD